MRRVGGHGIGGLGKHIKFVVILIVGLTKIIIPVLNYMLWATGRGVGERGCSFGNRRYWGCNIVRTRGKQIAVGLQ